MILLWLIFFIVLIEVCKKRKLLQGKSWAGGESVGRLWKMVKLWGILNGAKN